MESGIMESIGYWDQIYPGSQITLSYLEHIEAYSLIIISQLLESVFLWSQLIPLSSSHCSNK
jgi:hypothetical protein